MLQVGTLFSGIGAFEEALNQMKIPHDILFACDNGEIEFIPFEDPKKRKEYKDLIHRITKLNDDEKKRLEQLKTELNEIFDGLRTQCYGMNNNAERTRFINELYKKYSPFKYHNYVKDAYLANYDINETQFHTDIRFIKGDEYANNVDILVGGSPCQSFSTYGKKMGLNDVRGTLFYDYARIINECKPKVFIYENVNGLLSHDEGKTWEAMKSVWEQLGYHLEYQVLNAADYNFPQIRLRLFLIGIREDLYKTPYHFPDKMVLEHKSTEYLEDSATIPNSFYLTKKGFEWVTIHSKNVNRTRFNRDVIGAQTATQQDNWTGDLRVEPAQPRHIKDPRIYVGEFDFGKGPEPAVARKMTPRECMNLMGFNPGFKIVVPKTIAYRHAGNSIVVPVLIEIIKSLHPYLV